MKPTLLILAAGMGSRYGGLKQLDSLGPNSETIIDYSVHDAFKAGFGKVVFVIRESFAQEFKEKVSNKYTPFIKVDHVFQELDSETEGLPKINREKPWGTGHAVLVAKNIIKEPFAVINADDYYGTKGYQTMAKFLINDVSETNYSMMGYYLRNTLSDNGSVSRGVCTSDKNGYLIDVVERTRILREEDKKIYYYASDKEKHHLPDNTIVSMNFWGFHPNIFQKTSEYFRAFALENQLNPKSEFYIPLVVNKLLEEKLIKLKVLESNALWFGVTYKEDKSLVAESLKKLTNDGIYPSPLWN